MITDENVKLAVVILLESKSTFENFAVIHHLTKVKVSKWWVNNNYSTTSMSFGTHAIPVWVLTDMGMYEKNVRPIILTTAHLLNMVTSVGEKIDERFSSSSKGWEPHELMFIRADTEWQMWKSYHSFLSGAQGGKAAEL